MTVQTYIFHVDGMHCRSCVHITEETISEVTGTATVHTNLAANTMTVTGDFDQRSPEDLAVTFSQILKPYGYTVSIEKNKTKNRWAEFRVAVPIALALGGLFVALQKMGLVNFITASTITYPTAFAIGIIASLSTCMAIVGGLLLSMSATFLKTGDAIKPQILFHVTRLVTFFVLGGAIGMAGASFQLQPTASFILSCIIALVMLLLGINLLDLFPHTAKFLPTLPRIFARHTSDMTRINHTLTPALVGIATFFLPCGFTQSMQIYTLTTGNFISGGLTMLAFALGTLPVLAVISFSGLKTMHGAYSGIFFKTAGLIVILFALLNLIGSFVAFGLIPPLFNL